MGSVIGAFWREDHDRFGKNPLPPLPARPPGESDGDEILLWQVDRYDFQAIKSQRKRWEAIPLVRRMKGGGKGAAFAFWEDLDLVTEGRVVKFRSYSASYGVPPQLFMRVAEVRFYVPHELLEILRSALRFFVPHERLAVLPQQDMVKELGTDLLPDVADASARVQVYLEIYGADRCACGFVAMRLKWADEIKAADESSTRVLEEPRAKVVASKSADAADRSQPGVRRPRTCASPGGCGYIGCDDCYPPGHLCQNRRKVARRT